MNAIINKVIWSKRASIILTVIFRIVDIIPLCNIWSHSIISVDCLYLHPVKTGQWCVLWCIMTPLQSARSLHLSTGNQTMERCASPANWQRRKAGGQVSEWLSIILLSKSYLLSKILYHKNCLTYLLLSLPTIHPSEADKALQWVQVVSPKVTETETVQSPVARVSRRSLTITNVSVLVLQTCQCYILN